MNLSLIKTVIFIFVLLLLIASFYSGWKKGLLKKILSLLSLVITIVVTRYLTPMVVTLIKDMTNIQSTISDFLYKTMIETKLFDNMDFENIPEINSTNSLNETIKDFISNNLTDVILHLICGIIVFILVILIVKLILKLLDLVDLIPVIGTLNKILGGVLGVAESVLIILIIFTIVKVAANNIPTIENIVIQIKDIPLVGLLYDNNIIYNFFENLFSILTKK